ncbi:AraC family transcriptional regulator [Gordonia soli]|uniref:Putative transcriptional regulator n=1 Tax=Gordonia soli NBRC 108243 TaxID=1223545 RepID=M0QLH1_9ACTN|nr:helix-turn-helix domain-containing protein [Gordonia soli]GAC69269.1 putative transcriptional regulator [Gordonia soli NBRC 108243]
MVDDIERAHLVDPTDRSFRIGRWGPAADLTDLIRRFWVPVWSVPPGDAAPQRVLQYPVCLMVVTPTYARFYGVRRGVSENVLSGNGWAVGTMLSPAAGSLVVGGSVAAWTDRHAELAEIFGSVGAELAAAVRATMLPAPSADDRQHAATGLFEDWLRAHLPVDADGHLVNEIVSYVESNSDVTEVAQICAGFGIGERTLQRLTHRRLGLTPKWLIQRRRLQEASERLRDPGVTVARIAADLGYSDEAHMVRDFRTVTGETPGRFAARFGGDQVASPRSG